MATVTRNLIGNFVGRGIVAALGLLLIPVYIHFLGIESYALVAFYVILQTVFGVLDLGLTTTTNREIAWRVADEARRGEARDLLRTVEGIYWLIGVVIGVVIVAIAPWIATNWLQPPKTLSVATVQTVIVLMGINAALQWPFTMYEGALHGLQRIVEFNTVQTGMAVVRNVGAVVVVWLRPTVTAFFLWQLAVSATTTCLLALCAWRYIPAGPAPRFRMRLVAGFWRFAAAMTATAALGVVLSHSDRIVLSRLLPLENFGYYSVASTVATGLLYLMAPISLTVLPRFSELLAKKRQEDVVRTYHLFAQLMTVVLVPVALVLALFSREVVTLWTQNAAIAGRTATIVVLLVCAVALNALMDIPYMLQLAQGRGRLAVYTNLILVAVYLPLLVIMVRRYGEVGAAASMLVLFGGKFLIWTHVVHAHVLPAEVWRWYGQDVALPALAAGAVAAAARFLIPAPLFEYRLLGVLLVGAIAVAGLAAAGLAAPATRARALALLPRRRRGGKASPDFE